LADFTRYKRERQSRRCKACQQFGAKRSNFVGWAESI